ncbi:hypothetical protein [Sphingomonas crocodyli]|nr:hypothetical protein [Sphingomonas crocodyli]
MIELEKAVAALDGNVGGVQFNPSDPQSIEIAIQQTESAIDSRVGDYSRNEMVGKLVVNMKEKCRQEILRRAADARAGEGAVDDD